MEIFSFNGNAKRSEYWAVVIGSIVALTLTMFLLASESVLLLFVALGLSIAILWSVVATTVRRLRDAGLHPAWVIIVFIPYVSFIATIVFGCIKTSDANVS